MDTGPSGLAGPWTGAPLDQTFVHCPAGPVQCPFGVPDKRVTQALLLGGAALRAALGWEANLNASQGFVTQKCIFGGRVTGQILILKPNKMDTGRRFSVAESPGLCLQICVAAAAALIIFFCPYPAFRFRPIGLSLHTGLPICHRSRDAGIPSLNSLVPIIWVIYWVLLNALSNFTQCIE